jgi:hypothetical protein
MTKLFCGSDNAQPATAAGHADRPSLSPLFDSNAKPYEICDLQPAADILSAKLKQG